MVRIEVLGKSHLPKSGQDRSKFTQQLLLSEFDS